MWEVHGWSVVHMCIRHTNKKAESVLPARKLQNGEFWVSQSDYVISYTSWRK